MRYLDENWLNLQVLARIIFQMTCQAPLIIRSDNIFNIEVNGALAIHVIVQNSLTQDRNRLKFWIYDSFVDIDDIESRNRPLTEHGRSINV